MKLQDYDIFCSELHRNRYGIHLRMTSGIAGHSGRAKSSVDHVFFHADHLNRFASSCASLISFQLGSLSQGEGLRDVGASFNCFFDSIAILS
jgi:hypothetical protein